MIALAQTVWIGSCLILAGWLKDSARIENPQGLGPGSSEISFTWTSYGLDRLRQFRIEHHLD